MQKKNFLMFDFITLSAAFFHKSQLYMETVI